MIARKLLHGIHVQEQIFEITTGGAAIMGHGPNLLLSWLGKSSAWHLVLG